MAQHYGVKCKVCGEFIKLGDLEPNYKDAVSDYLGPLESIASPCSGDHYLYDFDDLITEHGEPLAGGSASGCQARRP